MLAMADNAVANQAARRERLAQRRKALGLTQEVLAGLLGVERSTVVRWERGETEPLPWIRPKLARALRVSADRLEELLAAGNPPESSLGPVAAGRGAGTVPMVPAGSTVPTVPRQLHATVADFTGRAAELAALTRILDDAGAGAPGTVVISAIGGTAGVGKTALAVHWAHHAAHRFADGQLYVNLRGFDPSGTPAAPAEAVRGFLDALGVPPERIPVPPDAQAALYRSLVADKQILIVLDNARDEQQVRPLLPASPRSLVLLTSRNQLGGLAAADGARLLSLDVLTHDEAIAMLTARVGSSRADAEPEAIAELAALCACLPLALAVAAARAAARPGFLLAALAAELRDANSRLDALDSGDPMASVQAVFSWSYRQLSADAARVFRLLGLHPGPDISVPAVASLAALDEPRARCLLRELTRAHLITEHAPGRYAFHDLLRAYAADQARTHDSERHVAAGRVLDHYLHTADRAARLLNNLQEPVALPPPRPGTVPEECADDQQAMAWFEAEHQVLLAVITLAAGSGADIHAWQLPHALMPFLARRGHYEEWAGIQRTALAAATRGGDTAGQAISSRLLALACGWLGDFDQALAHAGNGIALYQRAGDRLGEARVRHTLSVAAERQKRYADALGHAEHALRLYQAIGHKEGEADTLNGVGWFHGLLGDYEQARAFCRRSLVLSTEAGLRRLEAYAWDSLGYAEHHLGNLGEAAACYQRSLRILPEFGDRYNEAATLTHLGDTWHAAGELPRARDAWQRAFTILDDLQLPDADEVRVKLAGIDKLMP
jgi:tetratricopeptide (TPR) repeat protein/DNA-binding XRE family transcriptional regulator